MKKERTARKAINRKRFLAVILICVLLPASRAYRFGGKIKDSDLQPVSSEKIRQSQLHRNRNWL